MQLNRVIPKHKLQIKHPERVALSTATTQTWSSYQGLDVHQQLRILHPWLEQSKCAEQAMTRAVPPVYPSACPADDRMLPALPVVDVAQMLTDQLEVVSQPTW